MNKRVLVLGIRQETNSFNPCLTAMREFASQGIAYGEDVVNGRAETHLTTEGAVACINEYGFVPVGSVHMLSKSGGPVSDEVVSQFTKEVTDRLKSVGRVDGIFASLHGATLSESSDDVCGDLLYELRRIVGNDVPIAACFDLHGNITKKIADNADYVSGYQTYPHVDFYNTGYRAAKQLCEHLSGSPCHKVCVSVPIIAPPHGYTTDSGKLKSLMDKGHALVREQIISDFSVFQVQPWLDIPQIASTVVVSAKDKDVAERVAFDLAREELDLRRELQGSTLVSIDEVVDRALENKSGKPILLVESADSPNAGACGDSPAVLKAVLPYKDTLSVATAITDEKAVAKAFELGVGAVSDFELGGSLCPELYEPVTVQNAKIISLHCGRFHLYGPAEKGVVHHLGRVAVLEVGKILIHISELGTHHGDVAFFRSFGIEPTVCQLVSIKACTSFRAGYEPIAKEIYTTSAPGAAGPELDKLPFKRLPKNLYPFSEVDEKMLIKL